nr:Spy/CpxP family protein refolding chaperone [uncultured Glaciecola sp.]
MKKLLISLSVASLLSISAYSINAHERDQHDDNQRELMASLSLTQHQKEDIQQIHLQTKQDLGIYHAEQKQFRDSMHTLMQADIWDEMAVTNAIEQQMELTLQSRLIRAKSKHKVFNQLTEEQQAQFIISRHAMKIKKGNQRTQKPERKMQRLVKALDLNSDQQAQLLVMTTSDKAQRTANKEQLRNVKVELANIVRAKQFDDNAWLAVHAQNKEQKLHMAVNKAKSRFDMLNILNAEQRDKFERIIKKSNRGNRNKKSGKYFNEEQHLSS